MINCEGFSSFRNHCFSLRCIEIIQNFRVLSCNFVCLEISFLIRTYFYFNIVKDMISQIDCLLLFVFDELNFVLFRLFFLNNWSFWERLSFVLVSGLCGLMRRRNHLTYLWSGVVIRNFIEIHWIFSINTFLNTE